MGRRRSVAVARLEGCFRHYAWGSHTALAALQGREHPTEDPEAELWFGAHPSDTGDLVVGDLSVPLDAAIREHPVAMIGAETFARFGPRLPFLLKILAIERPLSLQVHPSARQAEEGFRDEEARGVPIDAPDRIYRDPWPKPELLCAISDVDVLAGFRDPRESCAMLSQLDVPSLRWLLDELAERGSAALLDAVERLLRWPDGDRRQLVHAVVAGARRLARAPEAVDAAHAAWIIRLAGHHPCDPGVVVALLLNLVHLRPGETIHLPPGNLHAYLRGTAIEVMATSDNVLRGGLTPKHVDLDGLLEVLDPRPFPAPRVPAAATTGGWSYPTSAEHFSLQRLEPGRAGLDLRVRAAEILLSVGEPATVTAAGTSIELRSGQAAFVAADAGTVRVQGEGPVFRASVGTLRPTLDPLQVTVGPGATALAR